MNSGFNKIINNIVEKNIFSQAYIIAGNDKEKVENTSLKLASSLICPYKYSDDCNKCNICKRIKNGSYPELKIVNKEGKEIKKEAIIDIRNQFQTNSVEGKNQVYIINSAELLNQSSANSILKFIEEPDSNTIAIFTTTNLSKIIPTIKSRCQIIKIATEKKRDYNYLLEYCNIEDNQVDELKTIYYDIELKKVDIINYKESVVKNYTEKEDFKKLLKFGLIFYKICLNKTDGILEIDDKIISKMDKNYILKKIGIILENLEKIEYNVNMSLFIMNYFIEMGE